MNKDDVARALMRKKLGEEMTHQPYQPMTPIEDTWNSMNTLQKVGMSPVGWPVTDVAGLVGDVQSYRENPEQRTLMNYGLSAAGLLPFVPAGVTKAVPKFTSQVGLERMLRSENKGDARTTGRIKKLQDQEEAGLISPGERHRALNRLTKSHKEFLASKK